LIPAFPGSNPGAPANQILAPERLAEEMNAQRELRQRCISRCDRLSQMFAQNQCEARGPTFVHPNNVFMALCRFAERNPTERCGRAVSAAFVCRDRRSLGHVNKKPEHPGPARNRRGIK
jgi:hypothetical protein